MGFDLIYNTQKSGERAGMNLITYLVDGQGEVRMYWHAIRPPACAAQDIVVALSIISN
jgi:hypothetical protein